jgi:hypothetical protein
MSKERDEQAKAFADSKYNVGSAHHSVALEAYKVGFNNGGAACAKVKDARIAGMQDHFDLMCDEFRRIKALIDNAEVKELCDRAIKNTKQHVPVIAQRDELEALLNKRDARIAELEGRLKTVLDGIGEAIAACPVRSIRKLMTEKTLDVLVTMIIGT